MKSVVDPARLHRSIVATSAVALALAGAACGSGQDAVRVQERVEIEPATTTTTSTSSTSPTTTIPPTSTTSSPSATTTSSSSTSTTSTTVPFRLDASAAAALLDAVVEEAGADPVNCAPRSELEGDVYSIAPEWTVGALRTLDIRSNVADTSLPWLPVDFAAAEATLEVTASDRRGASFLYRPGTAMFDQVGVPPAREEQVDEVVDAIGRLAIAYDLDSFGFFLGISNIDDVRAGLADVITAIGESAPTGGASGSVGDGAEFMQNLTDEELTLVFGGALMTFHMFDGFELEIDEPFSYDEELPTEVGSASATTTVRILEELDSDGCVRVEMRSFPSGDFDVLLEEQVEDLADEEIDVDLSGAHLEEIWTGQFDPTTRRIVRIVEVVRIEVDGVRRVETTLITDVT